MGAGAAKALGELGKHSNMPRMAKSPSMGRVRALGKLQGTSALAPLAKLAPLDPDSGQALRPGEASIPVGQSPMNPWGKGSGGSGALPLYRRPGTMPGT